MDIVQVNMNTPVEGMKALNVVEMIETDDELLIRLGGEECYSVHKGEKLYFRRYIYESGKTNSIITSPMLVINETDGHILHTTKVPNEKYYFRNDDSIIQSFECSTGDTSCTPYSVVRFHDKHHMYAQDIATRNIKIQVKDSYGNLLGEYGGDKIAIPYLPENAVIDGEMLGTTRKCVVDDCISFVKKEKTCGKPFDYLNVYSYQFLPNTFDMYGLFIEDFNTNLSNQMAYVEYLGNPFYYTREEEVDGKVYKKCVFWGDYWWDGIMNEYHEPSEVYINCGNTRAELVQNRLYYDAAMGLTIDSDETSLGSDDDFTYSYVKDVEDSLIPPVIDMERVKYIPVVKSENNMSIVTSITMNFHFRKRVMVDENTVSANTKLTRINQYRDGWYIDMNSDDTWWNGYEYDGHDFSPTTFINFINMKGNDSDLLGYLNFTDNDIFYKKQKVGKSFIRLSFYTSKDVTEQKLLYYSTIFLDSTELYGKYVRQLMLIEENEEVRNNNILYSDNENTWTVFCDSNLTNSRLDSKLTITNEYDRTKSAEGFNIYLFASDVDIKDENEDDRTIYMKVEFNHAGNGKTIPMIQWPKDDSGNYHGVLMSNLINYMYIPIKIKKVDDKYVYYIPSADNVPSENKTINLVLFEPKLDDEDCSIDGCWLCTCGRYVDEETYPDRCPYCHTPRNTDEWWRCGCTNPETSWHKISDTSECSVCHYWRCNVLGCGCVNTDMEMACHNCGAEKPCGPNEWRCTNCGTLNSNSTSKCSNCGIYTDGYNPNTTRFMFSPSAIFIGKDETATTATYSVIYYGKQKDIANAQLRCFDLQCDWVQDRKAEWVGDWTYNGTYFKRNYKVELTGANTSLEDRRTILEIRDDSDTSISHGLDEKIGNINLTQRGNSYDVSFIWERSDDGETWTFPETLSRDDINFSGSVNSTYYSLEFRITNGSQQVELDTSKIKVKITGGGYGSSTNYSVKVESDGEGKYIYKITGSTLERKDTENSAFLSSTLFSGIALNKSLTVEVIGTTSSNYAFVDNKATIHRISGTRRKTDDPLKISK